MGLLEKALIYKKNFLDEENHVKKQGLLKRSLSYLNSKANYFNTNDLNEESEIIDEKIHLIDNNNNNNNIPYFDVINNISIKLSSLSLLENAGSKLNEIITEEFYFTKNIFLIYSIDYQKFIYWNSCNIDKESKTNFNFDLKSDKYYNEIVKNKYLLFDLKNKMDLNRIKSLLSDKDIHESSFLLMVPFIFSGYIIGIYCALQNKTKSLPDNDIIEALKLIGRLNGSLLYNIYQKEKFFVNKNQVNEDTSENSNITSDYNNEISIGSDLNLNTNSFEKNINQIIEKNEINNFSLISLKFLNDFSRESFQLIDFYSDIQFIVMNLVGADAYVEILEDLTIYIILPSINKINADKIAINIIQEIKRIFLEVSSDFIPDLSYKIICYPEDAKSSTEILNKI